MGPLLEIGLIAGGGWLLANLFEDKIKESTVRFLARCKGMDPDEVVQRLRTYEATGSFQTPVTTGLASDPFTTVTAPVEESSVSEDPEDEQRRLAFERTEAQRNEYLSKLPEKLPEAFLQPEEPETGGGYFDFSGFGQAELGPRRYVFDGIEYRSRDGDQLVLPGILPIDDPQELDFHDLDRHVGSHRATHTNLRIPFIGSLDRREVALRKRASELANLEVGSNDWFECLSRHLYNEELSDQISSERWQEIEKLRSKNQQLIKDYNKLVDEYNELNSETRHLRNQAAEVRYEPVAEEPSKLARAAAFGVGAYLGAHLGDSKERQREAQRIARNIDYHTDRMRAEKGVLKDFHQAEITKLQAKLAALQVR